MVTVMVIRRMGRGGVVIVRGRMAGVFVCGGWRLGVVMASAAAGMMLGGGM